MAQKNTRNVILNIVNVNTTGSHVLHANCETFCLQARAVAGRLQLEASSDTEYWSLPADLPQSFSIAALRGDTLYFSSAAETNIEILEILNTTDVS